MEKDREQSRNITTYKEREQSTRGLPDNIRQVGSVAKNRKIYIEDYVTSYIAQLVRDKKKDYAQAVLLGRVERKNGNTSIYISGAVHIDEKFPEENSAFSNETWEVLYEDIKKYFDGLEVVGWARCVDEATEEQVDDVIAYIHQNQFSGSDKLLLLYDTLDKEMYFYVRSHGRMQWQSGYYIYYEKNEAMKNYRLDHQKVISEEQQYEDTVLEGVRKKMAKHEQERAKRTAYVIGGIGVIAATALLFLVATMQNNAAKIQELETTIEAMTGSMTGKNDSADTKKDAVETNFQITGAMEGDGTNDRKNERTTPNLTDGQGVTTNLGDDESNGNTIPGLYGEDDTLTNAGSNGVTAENEEKSPSQENQNQEEVPDVSDTVDDTNGGNISDKETSQDGNNSTKNDKSQAVEASSILGYYTVKKGDTLSQISCDFYQSVEYTELICKANNIRDVDTIFEGQVLVMPKK